VNPRIALVSCFNLPDWEVDDRPLEAALRTRGADVHQPAWDDPGVDWSRFDVCLIRTTWDYMERLPEYLAWAEHVAEVSRLLNPLGVVRWNTHKSYLRQLAEAGIPIAPTVWLPRGSRADVAAIVAERGWQRAFLKPQVGATARETLPFDADPQGIARAQRHLDRLLPHEGMMVQPYLARVETEGERSAIFFDGAFSHAVVKVPVPGDYRVQDDFGASDAPVNFEPGERDLAEAVMARVQRPGLWPGRPDDRLLYGRVDLLRGNDDEVVVSELELVEPSLFFRHAPGAAEVLAEALLRRLQ